LALHTTISSEIQLH